MSFFHSNNNVRESNLSICNEMENQKKEGNNSIHLGFMRKPPAQNNPAVASFGVQQEKKDMGYCGMLRHSWDGAPAGTMGSENGG